MWVFAQLSCSALAFQTHADEAQTSISDGRARCLFSHDGVSSIDPSRIHPRPAAVAYVRRVCLFGLLHRTNAHHSSGQSVGKGASIVARLSIRATNPAETARIDNASLTAGRPHDYLCLASFIASVMAC